MFFLTFLTTIFLTLNHVSTQQCGEACPDGCTGLTPRRNPRLCDGVCGNFLRDPCEDIICNEGEKCLSSFCGGGGGKCVPNIDACATVRCMGGYICQLDNNGNAQCVPECGIACPNGCNEEPLSMYNDIEGICDGDCNPSAPCSLLCAIGYRCQVISTCGSGHAICVKQECGSLCPNGCTNQEETIDNPCSGRCNLDINPCAFTTCLQGYDCVVTSNCGSGMAECVLRNSCQAKNGICNIPSDCCSNKCVNGRCRAQ